MSGVGGRERVSEWGRAGGERERVSGVGGRERVSEWGRAGGERE